MLLLHAWWNIFYFYYVIGNLNLQKMLDTVHQIYNSAQHRLDDNVIKYRCYNISGCAVVTI